MEAFFASNAVPLKRDPLDIRDFKFTTPNDTFLPAVDLRTKYPDFVPPNYQQAGTSSCVANATAGVYRFEIKKHVIGDKLTTMAIEPSRMFIYYNARLKEVARPEAAQSVDDDGSCTRDAFKCLGKLGVCQETTWPWNLDKKNAMPDSKAYDEALNHVVPKYERLDIQRPNKTRGKASVDEATMDSDGAVVLKNLQICLSEGHPVAFSIWWIETSPFGNDKGPGGLLKAPNLPGKHKVIPPGANGHAVFAIGYDSKEKLVLCQNSWGAETPYFWLPYHWISDFWATDDFWMLRVVGN